MATPIAWPLSLPDWLLSDGFSEQEGDAVISTEMGYGADKKRARYTKAIDKIQCKMLLDMTQREEFKDYFRTSLAGGALPFYFKNPFTGVVQTFRFTGMPTYSYIGGQWNVVSMNWERLP